MTNIKFFKERKIRTQWDAEKEGWWFSVVDMIAILTDSLNPRKYRSVLKTRLKNKKVSWLQIVVN